jgi:adenylate cyclase
MAPGTGYKCGLHAKPIKPAFTITMLSPKTKRNIYRILPFGMIWLLFSIVYTLLEKGLLGELDYYPATGNPYHFKNAITITPLGAFIAGLCIGTIEIVYFRTWFMQMSFGKKIIYKSTLYLFLIIFFLVMVTAVANYSEYKTGFFSRQVWAPVQAFVFSYTFFSVVFYVAAIIFVTQFFAEVSENVGLGVLRNFFTGKYHHPVEEERIFMFLDMKSSTTIAEHLGHVRYFDMLKEYYADLSEPVIRHEGEIYQYVGDEMVVSWKRQKGLSHHNCIHCFFHMKKALQENARKYQDKFGLVPEFKAGFHIGKVTTGEIGVIQKNIIFTGDVLNTTSRIQGLCNFYNVDNLISGELVKTLHLPPACQLQALGEKELKGRDETVELFTLLP